MNNLSKEKKQQLLVVVLITAIVSGVIWMGLISSQQKNLELSRRKTEEIRQKVEQSHALIKRANLIQEEMQQARADLQEREETMASGDLFQWFLSKMIERLRSRDLGNFSPAQGNLQDTRLLPKFPYRSVSYEVKLTGYYHEFGKFIAELENEFPYARVQNVEITPAASGDEKLVFSFHFVSLYHTNRAVTVR